jgi:hypothetical protein
MSQIRYLGKDYNLEVEKLNLKGVFLNPVFYPGCMVDRVTFNNEKYFAFNLAYHAFEKPEHTGSPK